MAFQTNVTFDLRQIDVFLVAFRDDFVKSKQEFKRVAEDNMFVTGTAQVSHYTSKQMERLDIQ